MPPPTGCVSPSPFGKNRCVLCLSFLIHTIQNADSSVRNIFACSGKIGHKATHFNNPHPTFIIKVHCHRRFYQRFGSSQLYFKPIGYFVFLKRNTGIDRGVALATID